MSEPYSEMEKRVVRKIDLHIMPWIVVSYLLNYLDRTNLGNARTLNNDKPGESLVEVLQLSGNRYNFIVAIFFVPYVLLEFPSNLALKYFTPSKWIARIIVSWAIVTICTSAVSTYGGLIACRIFLGICEAGFYPGIIFYLTFWYTTRERAVRMAIFAASVAVSGATGGLIATGVSYLSGKGGLHGWQWLFVIEGIPTFIIGILIYFFLPDFPDTATFLTDEERTFAMTRMGPHAPKMTDKHFDKEALVQTIKSWEFWLFAVHYFCMTNSLNAFGFFAPSLIAAMGFKGASGQAMSIIPNVFAFFVIIGNAWHSDRTKERPAHIVGGLVLVMIGYLLLAVVRQTAGRFIGLCLIACTNAAVIPFIAYRTATVTGATSTAIATGGMIATANTAGISAPYLFPGSTGPRYLMGNWTVFGLLGVSVGLTLVFWWKLGASAEYAGGDVECVRDEEVGEEDADVDADKMDKMDKMDKDVEADGKVVRVVSAQG